MTCCNVTLSLLTTRSWSPWMRTCNFAETLDSLAQVARDVVGDARVELDLDLAATLADALRVAGLEQLRRQLAAGGLLAQNL